MTMPQGAAGVDDAAWIADWVNKNNFSNLATRTQENVTAHYQEQVGASQSWNGDGGFVDVFFNVVMGGFETITKFVENLAQAITGAVEGTVATIGDFLSDRWNDLTNAIDWLHELIDGIVNSISNWFDGVPIVGPGISDVIDGIARMLGFTGNAQDTADSANKQIAIIKAQLAAGGTLIIDDFERSSSTSLGSDWEQWYTLAGSGTMGLDGNGNAIWRDDGMNDRKAWARYKSKTMTMNSGSVSAVVKTIGEGSLFGSDVGVNWLFARMTADNANYIYLRWTVSDIKIGYSLGGTQYELGSASRTLKNGDAIELQYGRDGLTYSFKGFVNGSLVLPVTDSAGLSLVNSNTKYVGMAMRANQRFLGQSTPSSIQVFTAVDAA